MTRPMGPTPTKGRVRGSLHHLWRVGFMYFAWYTTRAAVWVKNHVHVLGWFGSDGREVAVRLWTIAWLTFTRDVFCFKQWDAFRNGRDGVWARRADVIDACLPPVLQRDQHSPPFFTALQAVWNDRA